MRTIVQDHQAPLRGLYQETPSLAIVTDHARACGANLADPFHSTVEPMDSCGVSVPVGVHRAVGGLHDAPTPGDFLCAALAACQDSAVRMVANRLGIEILALEVRVTAQVNVRGVLGMEANVPVGFQSMTCDINLRVKQGTPSKLLESLRIAALRCCVVQQMLHNPPPVKTRFSSQPVETGEMQ